MKLLKVAAIAAIVFSGSALAGVVPQYGLRADNHIVTRRDAALVVGVSGHCRH